MFISFVDAKRKTLETGAVPTENLPSKRHDSKPSYRRPLVREISSECPSTSALPPFDIEGESANVIDESFEEFVPRVKETVSLPWIIKECSDLGIRMEHWDNNFRFPSLYYTSINVYNSPCIFSTGYWQTTTVSTLLIDVESPLLELLNSYNLLTTTTS